MISIQAVSFEGTIGYARRELAALLARVSTEPLSQGGAARKADRTITLAVTPKQAASVVIDHSPKKTRISGRTPTDLLHGVYRFLEKAGFLFTVRGTVPPELPLRWPAAFRLKETPLVADRGIRQHINFPMDISGYYLADAQEYIRNLARMKFSAITFHLYEEMGWFHDGLNLTKEEKPSSLYYTTRFPLCQQPLARRNSPNRTTFFIPEVESRAYTPAQADGLNDWLRRVMQTAKECGLHITASIEVYAPYIDAQLRQAGITPGPDTYATLSATAARAALKQYPEMDELELISREFEGSWKAPETTEEAWRKLTAEYRLPLTAGHGFPKPAPEDNKALARELWNTARALQTSVDARRQLLADPESRRLIGRRTVSCGLYMITRNVWHYLPPVIEKIMPKKVRFTALSTYGARWVSEYLGGADFTKAFLGQMRIYTWCEFDGMMFQQQNHCAGLKACLDLATRPGTGPAASGLLANHWRNAENDDSISYLAAATWSGITPAAFHTRHLTALCGTAKIAPLRAAFELIDDATDLATRTLFNSGFCPPFVWTAPEEAGNVSRYTLPGIAAYRQKLEEAARNIEKVLPHVRRSAGLERCRLLANRVEATLIHCDILANLVRMRKILLQHPGERPLVKSHRPPFTRLFAATRSLVARYNACTAALSPDRGTEGLITTYEQCLDGCLDKLGGIYLECAPTIQKAEGKLVPIPVLDPSKQKN